MPLSLKNGVYLVRRTIGELNPYNWSDEQIVEDLNWAAQHMCTVAQNLTGFKQVVMQNTPGGTQEQFLPADLDLIEGVKYFSGQLFDLQYNDWKTLQSGASTGSIPLYYYTKTDARELTPQSNATSDIVEVPIGPQSPLGDTYRTIIGVWPIPPQPATLHVWYTYYHRWMNNPTDPVAVPPQYLSNWAAYAIAKCKEIEGDFTAVQYYNQVFEKGVEDFRIYSCKRKQADSPARYGLAGEPWRRNPSSSVIVVDQNPMGP